MEKDLFISRKNKTKQNLWTQFMRRKEYSELLWRKYSCIEFCLKLFFQKLGLIPFQSQSSLTAQRPLTRRPRTLQRTPCAEQRALGRRLLSQRPWAHRHVWGPAALPTDASCHQVSPHVTCFTRALHFHYQSRYRILGVLEDILSGTFPGATFRPCG